MSHAYDALIEQVENHRFESEANAKQAQAVLEDWKTTPVLAPVTSRGALPTVTGYKTVEETPTVSALMKDGADYQLTITRPDDVPFERYEALQEKIGGLVARDDQLRQEHDQQRQENHESLTYKTELLSERTGIDFHVAQNGNAVSTDSFSQDEATKLEKAMEPGFDVNQPWLSQHFRDRVQVVADPDHRGQFRVQVSDVDFAVYDNRSREAATQEATASVTANRQKGAESVAKMNEWLAPSGQEFTAIGGGQYALAGDYGASESVDAVINKLNAVGRESGISHDVADWAYVNGKEAVVLAGDKLDKPLNLSSGDIQELASFRQRTGSQASTVAQVQPQANTQTRNASVAPVQAAAPTSDGIDEIAPSPLPLEKTNTQTINTSAAATSVAAQTEPTAEVAPDTARAEYNVDNEAAAETDAPAPEKKGLLAQIFGGAAGAAMGPILGFMSGLLLGGGNLLMGLLGAMLVGGVMHGGSILEALGFGGDETEKTPDAPVKGQEVEKQQGVEKAKSKAEARTETTAVGGPAKEDEIVKTEDATNDITLDSIKPEVASEQEQRIARAREQAKLEASRIQEIVDDNGPAIRNSIIVADANKDGRLTTKEYQQFEQAANTYNPAIKQALQPLAGIDGKPGLSDKDVLTAFKESGLQVDPSLLREHHVATGSEVIPTAASTGPSAEQVASK